MRDEQEKKMREFQRFKSTKMPSFYTHNNKDADDELTIDD